MTKRIAIFCDGANIYHALEQNFTNKELRFSPFFEKIVGGGDREIMRVYYYLAVPPFEPQASSSQRFIAYLQGLPYVEVRQKKLAPYQEGGQTKYREKGVDVALAVDMVDMAYRGLYDVAALVSGDADLVPAITAVKNAGKHAENYYFAGTQSLELRQQVDRSIELSATWLTGLLIDSKPPLAKPALPAAVPKLAPAPQPAQAPTAPTKKLGT